MRKTFITILLISFIFNFANAEEVKKNKEIKKELSAEDKKLVDEIMKSQKDIEESEKELKELKKLHKTVDELDNKIGTDKK